MIYTYIRLFSLSRCFSFYPCLTPCTSVCVCLRPGTRRTGTPAAPVVTQVTHHSSCTHGNQVDSDLSPINKPFRMPTRSARTSTTPKWRRRQLRSSRVRTTWHASGSEAAFLPHDGRLKRIIAYRGKRTKENATLGLLFLHLSFRYFLYLKQRKRLSIKEATRRLIDRIIANNQYGFL